MERALGAARDWVRSLQTHGPAPARRPLPMRDAYAAGWSGFPCVFVLSTGRVGTLTLTHLYGLSARLRATHEPEPQLVHAGFLADRLPPAEQAASPLWRQVALAARDNAVHGAVRDGAIYVETGNYAGRLAPALSAVFPDSRFVHLHRDPFEFVRSGMRRGYYRGNKADYARQLPRPGDPAAEAWERMAPLEKVAWNWAHVNQDALDFFALLPPERRLSVDAAGLFAGEPAVVSALFALAGVPVPPAHAVREVLHRKMHAMKEDPFPFPKTWSPEDRATVRRWVAPTADALGYATA